MIINETTKANAQAVLDYIEQHPEKHDQGNWFGENVTMNDGETGNLSYGYGEEIDPNVCGTTMCIAGTALWLKAGMPNKIVIPDFPDQEAAPWLGLESEEETHALFYNMDENAAVNMLRGMANGDEHKFWEFAEYE
jgi:hypothetical protein